MVPGWVQPRGPGWVALCVDGEAERFQIVLFMLDWLFNWAVTDVERLTVGSLFSV